MEILQIMFRTVFFYFFIMISYRLMGKREIGQLGIIDLIVSILIAELVAISIENIEDSIVLTIIPIAILVIVEIILAKISVKSRSFRNMFSGRPAIIINHGKVNFKEMEHQRYSLDDLLLHLRGQGIKSIDEVEYAFLETDGKLSVFKYNFFKIPSNYPLALIVDGQIQDKTLKEIKKSKDWLIEKIAKQSLKIEEVFYAFYKGTSIYIIKRDEII